MLTGKELWNLIEHMMPVYVIVLIGWALVRFKIITPVHTPGIARFVSVCGVPAYAFQLLAFNDPYQIEVQLVGADVLQKVVAFSIGLLYWRFAKNGKLDHVINFFMLATLPNTVLIGDALLDPLYGDSIHGKVVTIILVQCFVWYNFTISLYEMRIVLLDMKAKQEQEDAEAASQWQLRREQLGISSHKSTVSIVVVGSSRREENGAHHFGFHPLANLSSSAFIERTTSAPACLTFAKVVPIIHESHIIQESSILVDEGTPTNAFSGLQENETIDNMALWPHYLGAPVTSPYNNSGEFRRNGPNGISGAKEAGHQEEGIGKTQEFRSGMLEVVDPAELQMPERRRINPALFASKVAYRVVNRLKYVPLTIFSVAGFVYALLAYKYNWTMPYYVQTSLDLISQGAVGMAIILLGMTWAQSGKLISCGWRLMTYGMIVRFLVGPFIMIVTALAVGLKGNNYRFAVLQAVIPQGVISFVLAKEYNLAANQFSTAVVFQLLVFIPILIVYYLVLGAV